eukprot:scaffold161896_cov30-Tisochrysis_lutea.AAC.2
MPQRVDHRGWRQSREGKDGERQVCKRQRRKRLWRRLCEVPHCSGGTLRQLFPSEPLVDERDGSGGHVAADDAHRSVCGQDGHHRIARSTACLKDGHAPAAPLGVRRQQPREVIVQVMPVLIVAQVDGIVRFPCIRACLRG